MAPAPRPKPRAAATANFVFPNLQPGRYQITATFQGFNPVTIQEVVVETARSIDLVVQFEVAGVTEQVPVEGRSQVVETTSTTVANTVSNEQISKLPLAGRNILNFALLVPGAASSAGARDSEYNGLPGGAINITLDGVNNNSARFRSGGTSFFTFAPIRLGAIEEVTVSTAGLTADAGAEGAVQIQFVTKRGTNAFRGQVFDQIQSDKLNAQSAVNKARGIPKTQAAAARVGRQLSAARSCATSCSSSATTSRSTRRARATHEPQRPDGRGAAGHLPLQRARRHRCAPSNLLDIARATACRRRSIRSSRGSSRPINGALGSGDVSREPTNLLHDTFASSTRQTPNVNIYPTGARRLSGDAEPGGARRAEPAVAQPAAQPALSGAAADQRRLHVDVLHPLDRRGLDARAEPLLSVELRRAEQLRGVQSRQHARHLRAARPGFRIDLPLDRRAGDRPPISCRSRATTRSGTSPTR